MNIGQVIAQNRKSKGLSQIDVAKELGRFDIHVGNAAYFNLLIPDVFPLTKEIHLTSCEECIKK